MKEQDSLAGRIDKGISLTEQEQSDLFDLLTERCKEKTKRMLARTLRCVPDVQNYGIYQRVLLEKNMVSYCAGQSYPDEIRTVRECLIGRR